MALFYPHYSVLVAIDDSRMVNDDSMVINSWMVIICDYGIVLPTLFSISGY